MSKHVIPADFWNDFHTRYWEKHPGIFQNLFETPFITQERLFDAIVGMPSRAPSDRFWASRQVPPRTRDDFQLVPLEQHGPKREDLSLEGFFTRIRQQIGDLPVGLNIHQLEKAQPEIWFQFREFVHELNKITGELPSGRWDIDTFLGTYKTTPLGIHRDNASVFVIGVMGRRTYYTWPADYFNPGDAALSTLDTTSIQEHLDKAVRLDLGPGDLVYWPSSNWHFIASDGQPSAVISVSAYFGKKLSEVIAEQVSYVITKQLKPQNNFNRKYTLNKAPADPPVQLTATLELLDKASTSGNISDALQRHWFTYCSTDGLYPVSPDEAAKLGPRDIISVDPRFPIVWKENRDGELLIAANGLIFSMPAISNAAVRQMLRQLNSGQSYVASDFVEMHSQNGVAGNAVASLLSSLHKSRALRLGSVIQSS